MLAWFISFLLAMQGIPVLPNQSGTVTGVLRTADGKPAVGVRVAAMVRPDNSQDAANASSMAGLAETDDAGRFRLENIPPGRYYIVAGRVDLPTYYPGTQDMTGAAPVRITPGANLTGLDFAMKDASAGRVYTPDLFGFGLVSGVTIPLRLKLENGARIPVFSGGRFASPVLRLTAATGGSTTAQMTNPSIVVAAGEYSVSVENLPENCVVKALTYETTDLTTGALKVSVVTAPLVTITLAPTTKTRTFQSLINAMPPELIITLTGVPASSSPSNGVRVTGRMKDIQGRTIYLSGLPGSIYSDGTFEFRGVPPGRHAIVTPDHPAGAHPYAAAVVVGDRDVEGIALEETAVLPADIRDVVAPAPAGDHRSGALVPMAAVRGRIVTDATGQPVSGEVMILGLLRAFFPIDAEGRFEIPRLLPGSYIVGVSMPGNEPLTQTVDVGDKDVVLNLRVK